MRFYLGTHQDAWLKRLDIPLFLSRRTLSPRMTLPRALGPWALDSGGFTELSMYGEWVTSPKQYVGEVARFARDVGNLEWAAIQDWMCEPFIRAKTGLSLHEHQQRTVQSYIQLRSIWDTHWLPVLQGQSSDDYMRHRDMYFLAGVDLTKIPLVGLGSVCRRQATSEVFCIARRLADMGIQLHGFGVKKTGLMRLKTVLASSDSMAWSFRARRLAAPMQGCVGHKNCANCMRFALDWRRDLLGAIGA